MRYEVDLQMKKSISLTVRHGQCATRSKTPKCGGCTDQSSQRIQYCTVLWQPSIDPTVARKTHQSQTANVISISDNQPQSANPSLQPFHSLTLSAHSSNQSSFLLNCALLHEYSFENDDNNNNGLVYRA